MEAGDIQPGLVYEHISSGALCRLIVIAGVLVKVHWYDAEACPDLGNYIWREEFARGFRIAHPAIQPTLEERRDRLAASVVGAVS